MRTGQLRSAHHLLDRRRRVGNGDVLAHAAVEQQVLLQHHADLAAQLGGVDQADVDAVHQHAALLRGVEPLHELGEGALARAAASDDADHFTRAHVQAQAVQHGRRLGPVAERHLVELDAALQRRQLGRSLRRHFGADVEDVAQPRHRDAGLLEVGPQLGHAHDGLGHALGEHVEGDELAHGELLVHHQPGAVPQGGSAHQLADQVDAFMAVAGQRAGLEAGRHVGGELVVPAPGDGRLERARLHGLDAGDALDQQGLVLGTASELLVEAGA